MFRIATLAAAIALAAGLAGPALAQADKYPSKPIRWIAPFAPGGATDIVGRLIGERLSAKLGQQVLVENRSGAGGLVGTRLAVQAPGDGYTLVGVSFNYLIYPQLFKGLDFDITKDLAPVTQVVSYPSVLLVHPNSPYKTVKDLVEDARKNPGKIKYASSGIGTVSHIAGELLNKEAKVKIEHVPYRGGGPANVDVMAGHIAFHIGPIVSAIESIRGNRLRALAVMTRERVPLLPDVPTMHESGYPDFVINELQAVLAPGKTPPAIVERLNKEIVEILRSPDIREKFEVQGGQIVASSPAEFGAFIKAESARWNAVAKEAGIEAQQ